MSRIRRAKRHSPAAPRITMVERMRPRTNAMRHFVGADTKWGSLTGARRLHPRQSPVLNACSRAARVMIFNARLSIRANSKIDNVVLGDALRPKGRGGT